jgi:hypothetical protein
MWIRLLPASQPLFDLGGNAFCKIHSVGDTPLHSQNVLIKYVLIQKEVLASLTLENPMMSI